MVDHTLDGNVTTEDGDFAVKQFRENYPTAETVGTFYNTMTPEGYEEQTRRVNFNETFYIIDEVVRLANLSDSGITRESDIFDAGAGTGTVGKNLVSEHGFAKLVGCDASSNFVEHMLSQGFYKEATEIWMGQGLDKFPENLKCRFDLVTAAGVFLKGHMPAVAIEDCHAALKNGGYFVTAMRSFYWEPGQEDGFRDKFDELIASGKLEIVNSSTF